MTLIARPSSWRSAAQARRNPWHGCLVAQARNRARTSRSGPMDVWAWGSRQRVERESPTALHTNRSDMLNVSVSMSTAPCLAAALKTFPSPPPAERPRPARPRPTIARARRCDPACRRWLASRRHGRTHISTPRTVPPMAPSPSRPPGLLVNNTTWAFAA